MKPLPGKSGSTATLPAPRSPSLLTGRVRAVNTPPPRTSQTVPRRPLTHMSPFAPKATEVGSTSPETTTRSWNPGGRTAAPAAVADVSTIRLDTRDRVIGWLWLLVAADRAAADRRL